MLMMQQLGWGPSKVESNDLTHEWSIYCSFQTHWLYDTSANLILLTKCFIIYS